MAGTFLMAIRIFRSFKRLNSIGQASQYYARRRRKGLFDPAAMLYRTHRFTTAANDIDTAAVFGDTGSRTRPVTFKFALTRSGTGAGLVFEFGSTTRGIAAWVSGSDMGIAAGAGTAPASNGVTLSVTSALPSAGIRFTFVLAITPGNGVVEMWRDGHLIATGKASSGSFNGPWADTDHGAIANLSGTVNDRVPVGQRVALANVGIIGPVSVYLHQRAGA